MFRTSLKGVAFLILFRHFSLCRSSLFYGITTVVILGLLCGMIGFEYADELELAVYDGQQTAAAPSTTDISIRINIADRSLEVYDNGIYFKKYRIAVGKSSTPTPIGEWQVVWKDYNWGTGFGTRWMGLNVPWGIYGIHGTNKPWSIGQFASHGCIRMRNRDVEELFEWVHVGTPVKIEGRRVKVQRILKFQTSGPDVVMLQLKLKELGFLQGRADGIFGKATEESIKLYQMEKGLDVTGVANKALTDMLGI